MVVNKRDRNLSFHLIIKFEKFQYEIRMQLFALTQEGKRILASMAEKHHDYSCIECDGRVRLRGGIHRKNHFYHLQPNKNCRLNGKGIIHLLIQQQLFERLPSNECSLELNFPSIKRIADVAWVPHKIIFEIQCSPISAEEVKQRNRDYKSLGWEVVWILHDRRFNQYRLSGAEEVLSFKPHYFTNINREGEGCIYDQFALIQQGRRLHKLPNLPVDVISYQTTQSQKISRSYLKLVNHRLKHWPLFCKGDLIDISKNPNLDYLKSAHLFEKNYSKTDSLNHFQSFKKMIYLVLIRPYKLFFQILLEKACK